ncbi:MAG TPA: hypothetical protein VHG28_13305, partial [Longimicrobiaceae bacterium]|nr:hypothetical protein [Longimicrobiaceae bacterium]
ISQVAEAGTTVVFTCRDWEYDEYLAPSREGGSALTRSFHRRRVPWFDEDEVRRAATLFMQAKSAEERVPEPAEFAKQILGLSADSRSLREIVYNPLLLSLLCELFGDAGAVPPDLTVTGLYDRYWAAKVARGREGGTAVGLRKAAICLRMAEVLFTASGSRLVETVRPEDLEIAPGEEARAHEKLLSEGIYVPSSSRDLRFFHQTFLEYVLARWLVRPQSRADLDRFLDRLGRATHDPVAHWWPVLRQLLVLGGRGRFEETVARLDLGDVGAYRAVAFAAVALEDAAALRALVPRAREETGFRKALLFALGAPPRSFFDSAWEIVTRFLVESPGPAEAMQAAEAIGSLVPQSPSPGRYLEAAFGAVKGWASALGSGEGSRDTVAMVLGTLLAAGLEGLRRRVDPDILRVLRESVADLGMESRAAVAELHLGPGVSADDQALLLERMICDRTPPSITESVVPLFDTHAPWREEGRSRRLWASWREALYDPLPDGWELVRARSAGRSAVHDAVLLGNVAADLFDGEREHLHQNVITLHATVLAGGGDAVCAALLSRGAEAIGPERVPGVSTLVRHVAPSLTPEQRGRVAEWLGRIRGAKPADIVPALACVADTPEVLRLVTDTLEGLPLDVQMRLVNKCLHSAAAAVAVALVDHLGRQPGFRPYSMDAEMVFVARDRLLAAGGDVPALGRLAQGATGRDKKPALAAANALVQLAVDAVWTPMKWLLPLAGSPFPGVRRSAVQMLKHQQDEGVPVEEGDLTRFVQAFAAETDGAVVHALCELAGRWILATQRAPEGIGEVVADYPARMTEAGTFDGGTAKAVAFALRTVAQVGSPEVLPAAGRWARSLLATLTTSQVDNAQANVFTLLSTLGRRDPGFFPSLVLMLPTVPIRSMRVIVTAIDHVEGSRSPLLGEILSASWCPREIARLILGLKGG